MTAACDIPDVARGHLSVNGGEDVYQWLCHLPAEERTFRSGSLFTQHALRQALGMCLFCLVGVIPFLPFLSVLPVPPQPFLAHRCCDASFDVVFCTTMRGVVRIVAVYAAKLEAGQTYLAESRPSVSPDVLLADTVPAKGSDVRVPEPPSPGGAHRRSSPASAADPLTRSPTPLMGRMASPPPSLFPSAPHSPVPSQAISMAALAEPLGPHSRVPSPYPDSVVVEKPWTPAVDAVRDPMSQAVPRRQGAPSKAEHGDPEDQEDALNMKADASLPARVVTAVAFHCLSRLCARLRTDKEAARLQLR